MKKRVLFFTVAIASLLLIVSCSIGEEVTKPDTHEHEWILVSETPATCETDGKKIFRCETDNETKEEIVQAIGHNWVLSSETPATCENDGLKIYTCAADNKTKTEVIPKTGHKLNDTTEITEFATIVRTVCQSGEVDFYTATFADLSVATYKLD